MPRELGHRRRGYVASLPERATRATAAAVGGALYEAAKLLLPRVVRRSQLYEATARNALRIAIELVGGVADAPSRESDVRAGRLAVRKAAGNVVELGSIAAFGFSPLWLLAGASDVLHGSRVYLDTLVDELKRAGVLAPEAHASSVDELLGVLQRTTGSAARLIDIPPLELEELRRSLAELRGDAAALPSASELRRLLEGLEREAEAERATLLEVSTGVGLAFLLSARKLGREHLVAPYREDWRPLSDEGFAGYARRVAEPYRRTIAGHFDPARPSLTERLLERRRGAP